MPTSDLTASLPNKEVSDNTDNSLPYLTSNLVGSLASPYVNTDYLGSEIQKLINEITKVKSGQSS